MHKKKTKRTIAKTIISDRRFNNGYKMKCPYHIQTII